MGVVPRFYHCWLAHGTACVVGHRRKQGTFFTILVTGSIAFMHLPHSIANNVEMFTGLLVDSPVMWFDWGRFLVTSVIGNAIGGVIFVVLLINSGRLHDS